MEDEIIIAALILFGISVVALTGACAASLQMIRRSIRDYRDAATAHGKAEECYVKAAEILRAAERGEFRVVADLIHSRKEE